MNFFLWFSSTIVFILIHCFRGVTQLYPSYVYLMCDGQTGAYMISE